MPILARYGTYNITIKQDILNAIKYICLKTPLIDSSGLSWEVYTIWRHSPILIRISISTKKYVAGARPMYIIKMESLLKNHMHAAHCMACIASITCIGSTRIILAAANSVPQTSVAIDKDFSDPLIIILLGKNLQEKCDNLRYIAWLAIPCNKQLFVDGYGLDATRTIADMESCDNSEYKAICLSVLTRIVLLVAEQQDWIAEKDVQDACEKCLKNKNDILVYDEALKLLAVLGTIKRSNI